MISIVFLGTGPVATSSLQSVCRNFTVEAVITKSSPPHHKELAPVEEFARKEGLPLLFANTRKELDEIIKEQQFKSRIAVVVDYGVIISEQSINSFELGIVNSHFSLLPEWRGADPITFSLLSGQKRTGVSLMLIEPALDTGKLIAQKVLHIEPTDTLSSLTKKLVELSNTLIQEYLPRYVNGEIKPRQQPHPDRATYSRKIAKQDGIINWSKPAEQIEREIRAYEGWPQSHTKLGTIDVVITKATVETALSATPGEIIIEKKKLFVGTGHGLLEIHSIKPAGKKEMPVTAFLSGYHSKLN